MVGCCDYEAGTARPAVAPYQGMLFPAPRGEVRTRGSASLPWDEGYDFWWDLSEVVAHDHPSGNATPSTQDRELTAVLRRLGEAFGVTVLDHLVVVGDSFCQVTSIDYKNG